MPDTSEHEIEEIVEITEEDRERRFAHLEEEIADIKKQLLSLRCDAPEPARQKAHGDTELQSRHGTPDQPAHS